MPPQLPARSSPVSCQAQGHLQVVISLQVEPNNCSLVPSALVKRSRGMFHAEARRDAWLEASCFIVLFPSAAAGPSGVHKKQIRKCLLILIASCPARSALKVSSRLPGGALSSPRVRRSVEIAVFDGDPKETLRAFAVKHRLRGGVFESQCIN